MKKILIGIAAVVVLLIVAALVIPFFIPADRYMREITARVKDATGRDLAIAGDVKFSLLPRLEIEVNKVSFANAPGAADKNMATLNKLQVRVQMLPLLSGNVAIDSFVLVDPVIRLEIDKQGRPNWDFSGATPAAAQAKTPAGKPAPAAAGGSPIKELSLGDVKLVNATVSYQDDRTGEKEEITKVNLNLKLANLDSPLSANGGLVWKAKQIGLKLDVAKPRALLSGQSSAVALNVASEPIALDYKGTVTNAAVAKIVGDVDLKVPSVRQLAAWTGKPLDVPGSGFGPLDIKGKLDATGKKFSFSNADIAFDAIKAKGELAIDVGGAKPDIKGRLDVDKLDVNPYLPPEKPAEKTAAGAPAQPGATPGKAADWSDDPIDVSGLKAANADFTLTAQSILVRKIQIGKSALTLKLKDGVLNADLSELALYEGAGKGRFTVNGAGAAPAIDGTFNLAKVQAAPLLHDAADFDRLIGTMATDMTVNGHGRTQREIVSALQGKGVVTFTNGAIKGINLAAMVRNVSTAFLDSGAKAPQQTDFSELGGTYTITNGIVKNTDLALKSPLLRLEGAGTVDMPKRTVDYRVEPKVAMTTEGQGGKADVAGIMVPVIIDGPWDNLHYRPDLAGLVKGQLKDPGKALESLKGAIPGIGKPDAGATGTTAPTAPATKDPLGKLKGILGK